MPEPSGPRSSTVRDGQSGQRSISASAAALDGPDEKILAREAFGVIERKRELRRLAVRRAVSAMAPGPGMDQRGPRPV